MAQSEIHVTIGISAPIELIFDLLTDHDGMSRWPGVSSCRLVREGRPRNGLGAIREVKALLTTLQEEVVRWEPPTRFDYTIIKGLPVKHLGVVTLVQYGSQVLVSWDVSLNSAAPLVKVVGSVLKRGLPKALAFVKKEAERLAAAR